MNTIIQLPKRLECLKSCIKELREALSGADEDTLRILNDMEILLNFKDAEPILQNWDSKFLTAEEETNNSSTLIFISTLLDDLRAKPSDIAYMLTSINKHDEVVTELMIQSVNEEKFFVNILEERNKLELPKDIMEIHIQGFLDELVKVGTLHPDPSGTVYMLDRDKQVKYCTPFFEDDDGIPISDEDAEFNYLVKYSFPKNLWEFHQFKIFYKKLLNSLY